MLAAQIERPLTQDAQFCTMRTGREHTDRVLTEETPAHAADGAGCDDVRDGVSRFRRVDEGTGLCLGEDPGNAEVGNQAPLWTYPHIDE
jgi:hypothetical protein